MTSFLITDVRIFDGETVSDRGSVLVNGGRITKVSSAPIEFDGTILSKPGHTLLPGLIDAHVHIDFGNESGLAQGLRFGVTTQCDLGNAPFQIQKLRDLVQEGDCSDLKAAMASATPGGGWPAPLLRKYDIELPPDANALKTREDGQRFVRQQLRDGADYIKILHESGTSFGMELPIMPSVVEKAIVDDAHHSGFTVVAHAFSIKDTLEVLSLGIDGTAHTIVDKPPTNELIEAFQKRGAFCIPTLVVIGSSTEEGRDMQERYAHNPRVQSLIVKEGRDRMCQCLAMTKTNEGSIKNAIETVKRLKEGGIDIVCGTDSAGLAVGTAYGLSLHQELELFVKECGFSPVEALRSTTSLPAKRFNFADRGWIREGMRADLVLIEGDPTRDISRTLDLRATWIAGELCSRYKNEVQGQTSAEKDCIQCKESI